jgi:TRAP transporter TAXI family solute receptor
MNLRLPLLLLIPMHLLLLGACERGPDEATLRTEITETLETNFKPGLFELVSLRRMGSTPRSEAETGDKRLIIYFNTRLRFREAQDLTAWDGLNGASLAFLLGASESGIQGIRSGGNSIGDILQIHGSRAYALRSGQWRPIALRRPILASSSETQATRLIEGLSQLAEQTAGRRGGAEQAIVERELGEAKRRIERQLDKLSQIFAAAGGPSQGAYHRYLQALERNAGKTGISLRSYDTQGSVENCLLVQSGAVDISIAQSNIAALALSGEGPFKSRGKQADLSAVSALFPEYLQLVARSRTGIRRLEDLRGKRIDIGLPESGTRVDTLRVLEAAGLRLQDFSEIREQGLNNAVAALRKGELDGFFTTLQAPAHALQDLLAPGEAQLLSLATEVQRKVIEQHAVYRAATLPANSYPGQAEPVATLAVTAMLIARRDLPNHRVERLLDGLFKSVEVVAQENLRVGLLSPRTALEGVTLPVHPAAKRFLEQ